MKVDFFDKFYLVDNDFFVFQNLSENAEFELLKGQKFEYYWVFPRFVYTLNKLHDGSETFGLSIASVEDLQAGKNWRMGTNYDFSDIGINIFVKESQAWEKYHNRISKEAFEKYSRIRDLHLADLSKQAEKNR